MILLKDKKYYIYYQILFIYILYPYFVSDLEFIAAYSLHFDMVLIIIYNNQSKNYSKIKTLLEILEKLQIRKFKCLLFLNFVNFYVICLPTIHLTKICIIKSTKSSNIKSY